MSDIQFGSLVLAITAIVAIVAGCKVKLKSIAGRIEVQPPRRKH